MHGRLQAGTRGAVDLPWKAIESGSLIVKPSFPHFSNCGKDESTKAFSAKLV